MEATTILVPVSTTAHHLIILLLATDPLVRCMDSGRGLSQRSSSSRGVKRHLDQKYVCDKEV